MYRIYHDLNEKNTSRKYLSQYRAGLKRGIETIFDPLEKYLLD